MDSLYVGWWLSVYRQSPPLGFNFELISWPRRFTFRTSTVGKNLKNFGILNSTVENPIPTAFNFTSRLEKLLLRQVRLTRVNVRGRTETLLNVKYKLDLLEISDCNIGNLNFTFLNANAWHAKIINNQFSLSQEKAFVLKANNLNITNNTIETNMKGTMEISVVSHLHIEDNDISSSEELHNIFKLGKITKKRNHHLNVLF